MNLSHRAIRWLVYQFPHQSLDMEIEYMLDILGPLMPKQVLRCRAIRNHAEPVFKRLIDQEILRQGERAFGEA